MENASCCLKMTDCNIDTQANHSALFLTLLYPLFVCNVLCTVKLCYLDFLEFIQEVKQKVFGLPTHPHFTKLCMEAGTLPKNEESREINHHGDSRVVREEEEEADKDESKSKILVAAVQIHPTDSDLVNTNEQKQQKALKKQYENLKETQSKNEKQRQRNGEGFL